MVEKLTLEETILRANTNYYKRELARSTINLYNILKETEPCLSPLALPPVELSAASNAIEKFFGTYKTFKDALRKNGLFNVDSVVKVDFLQTYSLYAGAAEALFQLNKFEGESANIFKQGAAGKIRFEDDETVTLNNLVTSYLNVVKKKAKSSKELLGITKDFFEWVLDEATKESEKEKYADVVSQSNKLHIQINEITINGFNIMDKLEEQNYSFNHTLDDIVGNREMVSILKDAVDKVLMYDSQEKVNVNISETDGFSQTFNFWGRPGCGKTATIEALLSYATSQAEKNNKRLIIKNITNAFKDKYFSESANKLKKLLDLPAKGDAAYIFIADDIDTVFFSRDDIKDSHEDKAILKPLLDFLAGIGVPNLGNYLIISTTNRPLDGADEAAMSRLKENEMMIKGPKIAKDYADLFKIKLRNSINNGYVTVDSWDRIGELCLKYDLTGRAVKDVSKRVARLISDANLPADIAGKKPAEQKNMLRQLYSSRKVGEDMIINLIDQYALNEVMKKKQSWDMAVKARVNYKLQERAADEEIRSIRANAE
jgi:SpoVK/Ycf46/Vps4 family AAA+-type ATPase